MLLSRANAAPSLIIILIIYYPEESSLKAFIVLSVRLVAGMKHICDAEEFRDESIIINLFLTKTNFNKNLSRSKGGLSISTEEPTGYNHAFFFKIIQRILYYVLFVCRRMESVTIV